jgi:hypothetical protein
MRSDDILTTNAKPSRPSPDLADMLNTLKALGAPKRVLSRVDMNPVDVQQLRASMPVHLPPDIAGVLPSSLLGISVYTKDDVPRYVAKGYDQHGEFMHDIDLTRRL